MINERSLRIALAAILFIYVFAIRTYDVATTFLMLGEQARDWTIAIGGLTDLPLVGAPSTAGGRGFGPAYYWLLWLGRFTLGPFMDNLPHAGGVTVALLQSIADAWLFLSLSKRIHWGLALAACLVIASGPFDIAISSVIWNPPVSEALIKMAIAGALSLTAASPMWMIGVTVLLAWMAVQAHLSAIFTAAPLLAAIVAQAFIERTEQARRMFVTRLLVVIGVIVALQVPFVISMINEPDAPVGPGSAIAGLTNPQVVRPWNAYDTVTGITGNLAWPMPDSFKFAYLMLIVGPILLLMYRRDLIVLGATIGGVVTATLLFTTSTRSYDGYWFLTLIPALTLSLAMLVAAIPFKPAVKAIGLALLLLVAWRQPARIEDSKRFFKYPQYGPMVRASRELMMKAPVVKDIRVTFEVHPTMDRQFIYKILGGRIDGSALYTAVIDADGSVRLE